MGTWRPKMTGGDVTWVVCMDHSWQSCSHTQTSLHQGSRLDRVYISYTIFKCSALRSGYDSPKILAGSDWALKGRRSRLSGSTQNFQATAFVFIITQKSKALATLHFHLSFFNYTSLRSTIVASFPFSWSLPSFTTVCHSIAKPLYVPDLYDSVTIYLHLYDSVSVSNERQPDFYHINYDLTGRSVSRQTLFQKQGRLIL